MVAAENLTTAAFTVLALALVLVSLRAWSHTRSQKVLLLAIAFALLFAKGVFFSVLLFSEPEWAERAFVPGLVFDLAALAVFYVAVVRRSPA